MSVLVLKIMAAIYITVGVAVWSGSIDLKKIRERIIEDEALRLIAGVIGLTVGIVLLSYHNVWHWEWSLLVTLIGWGMGLGGIVTLLFPKLFSHTAQKLPAPKVTAVVMTGLGFFFGYAALSLSV